MGSCLSNQGKAESPSHAGMGSSKTPGRDGSGLHNLTRKTPSTISPQIPRMEVEILQSAHLKSFSFSQLRSATKNFRPESVLGEGGFGSVYKGWINENSPEAAGPTSSMVVAVKRLNQDGRQGHKEWLAEINYLGQIRHPNLVKLIGYCLEENHRLLVYEFMPKGSLETHLFWKGLYFKPLSWSLRMKIALDAATGLAFLHSDKIKVIYRDFKASNILLDSNFNAKLSDFGLARDGPADDKSHVSTRIMGTHGYAAPEYISTGHLTTKSDVYSFGVVLLEILTGRKAIDTTRPTGEQNLVDWAKPYLTNKRRICRAMDPMLEGQYPVGRARKAACLALGCLSSVARSRPGMDEVVKALEELQDSKDVSKIEKKEARVNRHDDNGPKKQTQGITGLKAYPRPSAIVL